jgi:hypothetical protein
MLADKLGVGVGAWVGAGVAAGVQADRSTTTGKINLTMYFIIFLYSYFETSENL